MLTSKSRLARLGKMPNLLSFLPLVNASYPVKYPGNLSVFKLNQTFGPDFCKICFLQYAINVVVTTYHIFLVSFLLSTSSLLQSTLVLHCIKRHTIHSLGSFFAQTLRQKHLLHTSSPLVSEINSFPNIGTFTCSSFHVTPIFSLV